MTQYWWDTVPVRERVLAGALSKSDVAMSASLAAMALHGLGRDYLTDAMSTRCPDTTDLVAMLAQLDTSPVAVPLAKACGPTWADQVALWHYDAAVATTALTATLTAAGLPQPVALQRAAAVYGATHDHWGDYVTKAAVPGLPPAAIRGYAGVVLDRLAAAVAAGTDEVVSKDQVFRYGEYEDVARDSTGRFVPPSFGQRQRRREDIGEQQDQSQELSAEDQRRQQAMNVRDERRAKRAKRAKRAARDERAAQAYAEAKARRTQRQQRTKRTLSTQQRQSLAAMDADRAAARVRSVADEATAQAAATASAQRAERLAARSTRREKVTTRRQRRARITERRELREMLRANAAYMALRGASGDVNYDPPPHDDKTVARWIDEGYHKVVLPDGQAKLYAEIPIRVMAKAMVTSRVRDDNNMPYTNPASGQNYGVHSDHGPRLSIAAAIADGENIRIWRDGLPREMFDINEEGDPAVFVPLTTMLVHRDSPDTGLLRPAPFVDIDIATELNAMSALSFLDPIERALRSDDQDLEHTWRDAFVMWVDEGNENNSIIEGAAEIADYREDVARERLVGYLTDSYLAAARINDPDKGYLTPDENHQIRRDLADLVNGGEVPPYVPKAIGGDIVTNIAEFQAMARVGRIDGDTGRPWQSPMVNVAQMRRVISDDRVRHRFHTGVHRFLDTSQPFRAATARQRYAASPIYAIDATDADGNINPWEYTPDQYDQDNPYAGLAIDEPPWEYD